MSSRSAGKQPVILGNMDNLDVEKSKNFPSSSLKSAGKTAVIPENIHLDVGNSNIVKNNVELVDQNLDEE